MRWLILLILLNGCIFEINNSTKFKVEVGTKHCKNMKARVQVMINTGASRAVILEFINKEKCCNKCKEDAIKYLNHVLPPVESEVSDG